MLYLTELLSKLKYERSQKSAKFTHKFLFNSPGGNSNTGPYSFLTIYSINCFGTSPNNSLGSLVAMESLSGKSFIATNCTISLGANLPFLSFSPSLSPSKIFIFPKSAFPIPTIIIDNGYAHASIIISMVSSISVSSPSVHINNIKYFSAPLPSVSHTFIIFLMIGAQFYIRI
eukprot:NODE_569_length_6602_cov_0.189143.p3 type:complete len:173 gc:universal NODE_569_length_6602_cov_0.189143:1592-2110(+)